MLQPGLDRMPSPAPLRDDHGALCGIDVSLALSRLCIVDATGRIIREAKVASEPDALITWFRKLGMELTRIGLEARVRCRNGCMRRCGMPACRSSCWKLAMCGMPLRRCRSRPTAMMPVAWRS